MRYSLMVTAGPGDRASRTALETLKALLDRGHSLEKLFLYRDGVLLASSLVSEPPDNIALAWQGLVRERQLPATVCVGAAARRGVVDAGEAERRGLPADNLADGFTLAGLGEWVQAAAESDRVLVFGG